MPGNSGTVELLLVRGAEVNATRRSTTRRCTGQPARRNRMLRWCRCCSRVARMQTLRGGNQSITFRAWRRPR
ncbi:MAG: hypothetical protein K9N62_06235 [Verrucomicrobia bacterium]|nr:hypothetical protein [Verrucomicrobiota bacterium]